MAAGTATLRFVREEGLAERAALLGARMLTRLRALRCLLPAIGDVRGRGLMLGVEIVDPLADPDPLGARPAAPGLAAAVREQALRRGLIVELGGRHGSVVRLLPPLTMTDEQTESVLDRLGEAVHAATALQPTARSPRTAFRHDTAVLPGAPHSGAAHPAGPDPGAPRPAGPLPGVVQPAVLHPGAAHPVGPLPGVVQSAGPPPGAAHPAGMLPGAVQPAVLHLGAVHPVGLLPEVADPAGPVPGVERSAAPRATAPHAGALR
jgi:hypothetical protein